MFNKLRQCLAISLLGVAGLGGNAHAGYTNLVFFRDSLSDTGNVLSLTTALSPPSFPNYAAAPGRFSNGPAWTEYLAAGLGLASSANPSNLIFDGPSVVPIGVTGGQNYSFGGTRTGLSGAAGDTIGLLGQLLARNGELFGTSLTRAADPNTLYVVMAGAIDLRDARTAAPSNTLDDAASRATAAASAASAASAAQNIVNVLGLLAQTGVQHFLISNLPDLGKTPDANF
jgi:outer membrane lipase/esterase